MNRTYTTLLLMVVAIAGASGGYWFAKRDSDGIQPAPPENTATRKVLYWYDPMEPDQHFDKPGKSPFMDMELVAKYADEDTSAAAESGIRIDSGISQNLGIRLATVQRGMLDQSVTVSGSIGFNQRNIAIVQTRSASFVSKVYQRAAGDVIKQGAALVDLLIPEWTGAQTEFLALRKSGDQALIDAARQRLMLLGMTTELISHMENSGQPQTSITITSPISGVISSLDVRAGMSLSAGATLATINGLDTVWLEAAVPEAQSAALSIGSGVSAILLAYPAETFKGRVIAILPETDTATRTARVRVELPNPQGRLRAGQVAQVTLTSSNHSDVLLVPSEAVIRSGTRNILIVATDNHRFQPVEVTLGPEAEGKTSIVSGVDEGQQVVASGQFLIDSEASLQGVLARLNSEPHDHAGSHSDSQSDSQSDNHSGNHAGSHSGGHSDSHHHSDHNGGAQP